MSDSAPTLMYDFKSAALLKQLMTTHASLHLDDRIKPSSNPPQEILTAINADIAVLRPYGELILRDKTQGLAKVAINTKKAFGKFSDTALISLATNQDDLTTKADAFAVLDNPAAHTDLIDNLYSSLKAQENSGKVVDLKAAAHATAGLYSHVANNTSLFGRAQQFSEIVHEQSFVQSTPHHLTNLALFSNKNFLPAALALIERTKSAHHANQLLEDKTGVLASLGSVAKADSIDKLTSVVVDAGNLAEIKNLATNTNIGLDLNAAITDKFLQQGILMRSDKRLALYLTSLNRPLTPEIAHKIQRSLNNNITDLNSVASQTALVGHARLAEKSNPAVNYNIDLMESSLNTTKSYFDRLEEHNKDKTLIDLAQPVIEFASKVNPENKEVVVISSASDEATINDALVEATAIMMKRNEEYEFSITYNPGTSDLIQSIISGHIYKSIEGVPNDLNRLLKQPVSKVVDMLDSRVDVQERIKFDANIQNKDNTATSSIGNSVENFNETKKNAIFELEPVLTVTNKRNLDESSTFALMGYQSFDDLAEDIFSKHDGFDQTGYSVVLNIEESQPYLSNALTEDLKDFMSEPSSITMYRLNQHWQMNVNQFVDARENNVSMRSTIKENIQNKDWRDSYTANITDNKPSSEPQSNRRASP